MLPHFMIIGAQKSATTYLQQLLETHPQIFLLPSEIPYFEDPTYSNHPISDLERKFENAPPEAVRGLKRPNYLGVEDCPARIVRHVPDAKFIIVLREPASRLVSAYFHYMRGNVVPCGDINHGVRMLLCGDYSTMKPRAHEILEFGLYATHLKRYFEFFPREAFYITEQKYFLANWESVMGEVCNFLGVDSAFKFQKPAQIGNKGVYAMPRVRLRQIASSMSTHWFGDLTPLGVVGAKLKNTAATLLKGFDRAVLAQLYGSATPQLDDETREMVDKFYEQDKHDLAKLLGGEFSHW